MRERWENDERGHGVGDARHFVPGARELLNTMAEPGWVAEDADAHLLPHLRRACGEPGSLLALDCAEIDADGVLLISLSWRGDGDRRAVTRAVWALVGTVAESASYVRGPADVESKTDAVFEVVTGMLAADAPFTPHGHALRIVVVGAP